MEFTFEMNYNQKAMTAMARVMRKGIQAEQDKKSKMIGWGVVVLGACILLFSGKTGWMQIVAAVLLVLFAAYLIWNDPINGFLALRKLPAKLRKGQWLFREDGYFSNTEAGESDYSYENIFLMAESQGYIFLVFHDGQAHILELSTIQGGTAEEFRRMLRRKTSLTLQQF